MKVSLGKKTLLYPAPVCIVGSYDREGKPNVMTAAWVGICCSSPPCIAVSLRKATYTYGNILERKAFTISLPSEGFVREADYFGITSGRDENKFTRTKLTPVRGDLVDAPYVKEFPIALECSLHSSIEIGLHTEFIGEILDVKAEESCIGSDGLPDIEKIRPLLFSPEGRKYHGVGGFLGNAFQVGRGI